MYIETNMEVCSIRLSDCVLYNWLRKGEQDERTKIANMS